MSSTIASCDSYDLQGHVIFQYVCWNGAGGQRTEYWIGGRHLVTYSSWPFFNHADWLGTDRYKTTPSGGQYGYCVSDPFGDNQWCPEADGDISPVHFTGKERDGSNTLSPTNLDNFGARYYSSAMGRFMTPDWAAKPTAVPYASFGNPQSLNLYSYVKNNPTTVRDPDGHCCDIWDIIDFVGGAVNAYSSDNLAGAGRAQQDTPAGRSGAALGDAAATVQGGLETIAGAGGEVGGVALDSTGVGALVGVPANVVSAGVMVHGAVTAGTGAKNLLSDAMQSSGNAPRSDLPRDKAGNYTPDPSAQGPHSTIGTRTGSNGVPYRQGATFDENGNFTGRTDVTDHGRADHENPHFHPAKSPNSVGPHRPVTQ